MIDCTRQFIAFDEDQEIRGWGPTTEAALSAAAEAGHLIDMQILPATDELIDALQEGDVSWFEVDGVAHLDRSPIDP